MVACLLWEMMIPVWVDGKRSARGCKFQIAATDTPFCAVLSRYQKKCLRNAWGLTLGVKIDIYTMHFSFNIKEIDKINRASELKLP